MGAMTTTSRQIRAGAMRGWPAALALWLGTIAIELLEGRPVVCTCGRVTLWAGTVQSAENSQQLLDWYSFSHVIHGLLLFGAAWLLARRFGAPVMRWAFPLALGIECGWELLENSPIVIDRYRAVTVSWGYAGDSVLNSASDVAMMALGWALAARLRWRHALALGIGFELFTLAMIRDDLALNVLMLVWPIDAVRRWQGMG